MEVCAYCSESYHPMTVWTRPGKLIHVCDVHYTVDENDNLQVQKSVCPKRAERDGYTRRDDLTPRR